jgi:hypothetical protein
MPSKVHIGTGQVFEGEDVIIMHRLYLPDGNAVTTSNITGNMVLNVYEVGHPTRPDVAISTQTVAHTGSTTAGALFPGLTNDNYWDADSTGYNFKHRVQYGAANSTSTVNYRGGRKYRHEYSVSTDSFGTMYWVSIIEVLSMSAV